MNGPGAGAVGRAGRGPIPAAIGLASVSVFPAFFAGAVGVQLRADLGLGQAQLGAAVSGYFAASAVSVAVLGRLVDRIGERRGYQLGAGLALVSLAAIALAARTWSALVLFLAIGGVGNAIVGPASSRLLARGVDLARRGWAFGIKQAAIMLATLLGGVGVPVIALQFGWRWVYALGAVLAAGLFLMVPRWDAPVRDERWSGGGRQRRSTLVLLAVAFGLGTSASVALTTFLADYAVLRGVSEGTAGLLLAFGSVGAIVIRLVLGWWSDHGLQAADSIIAAIFGSGAVSLIGIAYIRTSLLPVAAVIAFTLVWGWTGLLVYLVAARNMAAPGAATGLVQTGAATGGVLGPSVLGALAEAVGYRALWLTAAVMLMGALCCILLARRAEQRHGEGGGDVG